MTLKHSPSVLLLALLHPSSGLSLELPGQDLPAQELPTVLTPARLEQPRVDVPASVTVIDRDMIKASGIREIPELFRLVPGTAVATRDGWNYVVSYHGTNYRDPRRMQVLVNGRSVYQAGFATVDWSDIPIDVNDIERIEVVRGPSTALYGANAFLGVVNIITRHAADSKNLRAQARIGSINTEDYYVSVADSELDESWKLSAASRHDSGFDKNRDGEDRRDNKSIKWIRGEWNKRLNSNWSLSMSAGYKNGKFTEDKGDDQITFPNLDVEDYFASAVFEQDLSIHHSRKLQFHFSEQDEDIDFRACVPRFLLGLSVDPNGISCGDVNDDMMNTRYDIDFQETRIHSDKLKTVSGFHLKHSRVKSDTFFNGRESRDHAQIFASVEYRISPKWLTNISGSYEYEEDTGEYLSPRVALLFQPQPGKSFRAVYSEAVRTPDLFESAADWSYYATDISPAPDGIREAQFLITARGNPDLKAEKIISREIGYFYHNRDKNLSFDVKWYHDDFSELISDQLDLASFNSVNFSDDPLEQTGFEIELDVKPTEQWRTRLTFARINSHEEDYRERTFTPRSSGSALISYQINDQWAWSSSYYYAREINDFKFSRLDSRVSRTWHHNNRQFEISGLIRHRLDDDGNLFKDNLYDKNNHFLLSIDVTQ